MDSIRNMNLWCCKLFEPPFVFPQIDLMPHDVITQLLRVLAIETKQEKAIINAEPTDVALSGLEAFSFDYIVKWPLSLIINRSDSAAAFFVSYCWSFLNVKGEVLFLHMRPYKDIYDHIHV